MLKAKVWIGDQIKAPRHEQSKSNLGLIEKRLALWKPQVLPKSPIGQTIAYAQGHWAALNRHADDGILAIDNNLAERTLRMVASGHKNWLLVGRDSSGHRAEIICSLVAGCKLCGIDPFACFRGVLERIGTHPTSRIAELIPRNWKPSRPQGTPHPLLSSFFSNEISGRRIPGRHVLCRTVTA